MNRSPEIGQIAKALAAAQGEMNGAVKNAANPFFKSKYADLASVWDAIRGPFTKNGLAIVQTTHIGKDDLPVIETMLMHSSGEWIKGQIRMVPKDKSPQGIGSAITYARRYALAAIAGVAPEDDDGNAASGKYAASTPDSYVDQHGVIDERWDGVKPKANGKPITTAQRRKLFGSAKDVARNDDEAEEIVREVTEKITGQRSTKQLTAENFDAAIEMIAEYGK